MVASFFVAVKDVGRVRMMCVEIFGRCARKRFMSVENFGPKETIFLWLRPFFGPERIIDDG